MNTQLIPGNRIVQSLAAMLLIFPAFSAAQTPVDDDGKVLGTYESAADTAPAGEDGSPRSTAEQLQELVGPIALYPDDLLAIVLPASAYPLQIVAAARFLKAHESDPSLEPDPKWDDSVVALINYPEVIELLNDDLDWTYRLGEAVVSQQADVVAAIEAFRDRAYASGNLKSDSYQTVSNDEGVIEISPAADDVIYVPYYEPERVVVYQSRPAYFYYPRPYPVYYYPYASNHYFDRGFFWGVTTAFSIGWFSDSLHVYHHSYHGHPYYGHSYHHNYWYRRPSIHIYNTHYVNNSYGNAHHRYSRGDRWHARSTRRTNLVREGYARSDRRSGQTTSVSRTRQSERIRFREREGRPVANNRNTVRTSGSTAATRTRSDAQATLRSRENRARENRGEQIAFRARDSRGQQRQDRTATTRRQQPAAQARETRRQQPAAQIRETRRQQPAAQVRETRRQQPAAQSRDTRPQPTVRQRAPARQDHKRSENSRREQPPQQREARRESSSSSEKPARRSEGRRGNDRDRSRR